MKIGFLGAGSWGFCLANLLASQGHHITSWTKQQRLADAINAGKEHPYLAGHTASKNLYLTTNMQEAVDQADMIVEAVTSSGIRPVFEELKSHSPINVPIVLTSKGIEEGTCQILPDVVINILGEHIRPHVACISGPSFAQEVIKGLPTSVVASSYNPKTTLKTCETFTTSTFRVYPNADIKGVAFGGALKNVIAIACGISDGLMLGNSSKAALMTRGLHEVRKLAIACGCKAETLYGLSGMGDFVLTCNSLISRNFRFGHLLAQGMSAKEAMQRIEMVVEGAHTCLAARQLGLQNNVSMPITEMINNIIHENIKPTEAVQLLMQRTIKEEHL